MFDPLFRLMSTSRSLHASWVRLGAGAAAAALLLAACGGGGDQGPDRESPSGVASAATCAKRTNDSFDKLLECVTLAARQSGFTMGQRPTPSGTAG